MGTMSSKIFELEYSNVRFGGRVARVRLVGCACIFGIVVYSLVSLSARQSAIL